MVNFYGIQRSTSGVTNGLVVRSSNKCVVKTTTKRVCVVSSKNSVTKRQPRKIEGQNNALLCLINRLFDSLFTPYGHGRNGCIRRAAMCMYHVILFSNNEEFSWRGHETATIVLFPRKS